MQGDVMQALTKQRLWQPLNQEARSLVVDLDRRVNVNGNDRSDLQRMFRVSSQLGLDADVCSNYNGCCSTVTLLFDRDGLNEGVGGHRLCAGQHAVQ